MLGSFSQTIGASILSYNIISAAADDDSTDVTTETPEPTEEVTAATAEATEPATEETSTSTDSSSESASTVTEVSTESTTEPKDEIEDNQEEQMGDGIFSKLEIELCNQLEIEKEIECTVNIFRFKSDEEIIPVLTENIILGKEWNSIEKFSTDYIENGEYIVEIHAPGFEKFRKTISNFENMVCTLTVTLGFHKGYTYADTYKKNADGSFCVVGGDLVLKKSMDKEHPGVMRYGDVNNDGEISVTDEIILLNAVDSASRNANGEVSEEFSKDKNGNKYCLDLNNDGAVDIMDMALFTETYIDASDWDLSFSVDKETSEKYDAFIFSESVKPLEDTESVGASIEELLAFTSGDNKENKENADGEEGEETEKEPPKPMQLKPKTKIETQIVTKEVPVLDDEGNPVVDENGEPVTKTEEKEEEVEVEVEISPQDPVGVNLPVPKAGTAGYSFGSNAEAGWIEYVDENGKTGYASFGNVNALPVNLLDDENGTDHVHTGQSNVNASVDKDGNITVNFGNQTAIKKISLKISAVSKNTNLAEIATVKVLNGMESKTPAPQIDYPTNLKIEQLKAADKDAGIRFTWAKPLNGSGKYEFEVSTSPVTKADGSFASVISGVTNNETEALEYKLQSEHGNFKLIKINTTYYVHVRCIGEDNYKSAWSDMVSVTTVSNNSPDKPDYVSATGGYKSMKVSWSSDNTNSTTGYRVYFKNITAGETKYDYKDVGLVTSYQFTSMADKAEYEFYVIGYNSKGDSPESVHAMGKTTSMDPIEMHKYNVINCDESGAVGKAHLVSVTRNGGDSVKNDTDTLNAQNGKKTAWSVVDGDQGSYYEKKTWDDGGYNGLGSNGITYEFDAEYDFGSIAVARPYGETNFTYTKVRYWKEDGTVKEIAIYGNQWKLDKNGRGYHVIKFPEKITAKKIQIGFANGWVEPNLIAYSEIYFYAYDSTMDEVMDLYVDDLHTVLKEGVTQKTIDDLRKRINTPDSITKELNPEKDALERELATAEKILNAKQISKAVEIHNGITTYDPTDGKSRNYSGLNAWQPLGVSIGTNTEVTIYVGSDKKKTGDSTELRLICTQYNSESKGVELDGANLKIGANTFNLTKGNIAGAEAGGSLYIQYSGGTDSQIHYSVRVTGGTEIPVLDIYNVTDRDERVSRAAEYITALEKHVDRMEEEHDTVHKGSTFKGSKNTKLDYDYNEKTCIAGATEILDDTMMYSLPAPQILAGLGSRTDSVKSRAEKLITSMDAMEDMMHLFYQHKGMSADAAKVVDRIPNRHLNIRYQRMFQGAFMYAAGNHIGIQYGSASGMVNSTGVKADENGKYVSGSYFGWGIAHEIGHNLNDSSYVDAEITNNYFALLAQAQDKNEGSRLNYNNIFKKVSSNTKGKADQGTQLGLYWQLHLAFDKDYNFTTYDTNAEILENLFYARMDTYSRDPSRAPKPFDNALTLGGGSEQNLMRLACAASEKNVLEFFERWGMTPDGTTREYASQFPKETRAIMYANEDSRVYAMSGESTLKTDEEGKSITEVIDDVKVKVGTGAQANKVNLSISVSDKIPAKDILGYEVIRCTISGGDTKEAIIGFTKTPEFTDTVTSFNNRTVSYKVVLVDQYLNRSATFVTDMVKISHDGSLEKAHWNISTSNLTAEAVSYDGNEYELPCSRTIIDPAASAVDDDLTTYYEPKITTDKADIILNFNQSLVVTGMKYTAGNSDNTIGDYKIYVMNETGTDWIEVSSGTFGGSKTVYFSNSDDQYISTYDTTAVKLEILNQKNKSISIAELDVLGVTGDNVDFRKAKDGEKAEVAFGILSDTYKYGKDEDDFIPKNSLVFTGSYKGNPAYNAVILFDGKGNIVGKAKDGTTDAESNQIILADVPKSGVITDVSDGTWVYWIEPEDVERMIWPEKVRVELYRVNNIITNEGQRIVSDSLYEAVAAKDSMPSIKLDGDKKYVTELALEAVTKSAEEETESSTEPVTESSTELTTEPATEPKTEITTENTTESTTKGDDAE